MHRFVLLMVVPVVVLLLGARGLSAQSSAYTEALAAGDAHHAAFENEAAIADYEAAQAEQPNTYDVLLRLTRTYNDYAQDLMAEGQKDQAEATFEEAVDYGQTMVERFPERAQSHFFLAAAYGQLALFKGGREKVKIGQAVEELSKEAIRIDPDFPLPYIALGIFYREVSELNWIQRTFANALFGDIPDASKEDAVEMLQKAIERDETLTTAHFELGKTYQLMGDKAAAKRHFERTLALEPNTSADVRSQRWVREMLAEWR